MGASNSSMLESKECFFGRKTWELTYVKPHAWALLGQRVECGPAAEREGFPDWDLFIASGSKFTNIMNRPKVPLQYVFDELRIGSPGDETSTEMPCNDLVRNIDSLQHFVSGSELDDTQLRKVAIEVQIDSMIGQTNAIKGVVIPKCCDILVWPTCDSGLITKIEQQCEDVRSKCNQMELVAKTELGGGGLQGQLAGGRDEQVSDGASIIRMDIIAPRAKLIIRDEPLNWKLWNSEARFVQAVIVGMWVSLEGERIAEAVGNHMADSMNAGSDVVGKNSEITSLSSQKEGGGQYRWSIRKQYGINVIDLLTEKNGGPHEIKEAVEKRMTEAHSSPEQWDVLFLDVNDEDMLTVSEKSVCGQISAIERSYSTRTFEGQTIISVNPTILLATLSLLSARRAKSPLESSEKADVNESVTLLSNRVKERQGARSPTSTEQTQDPNQNWPSHDPEAELKQAMEAFFFLSDEANMETMYSSLEDTVRPFLKDFSFSGPGNLSFEKQWVSRKAFSYWWGHRRNQWSDVEKNCIPESAVIHQSCNPTLERVAHPDESGPKCVPRPFKPWSKWLLRFKGKITSAATSRL